MDLLSGSGNIKKKKYMYHDGWLGNTHWLIPLSWFSRHMEIYWFFLVPIFLAFANYVLFSLMQVMNFRLLVFKTLSIVQFEVTYSGWKFLDYITL